MEVINGLIIQALINLIKLKFQFLIRIKFVILNMDEELYQDDIVTFLPIMVILRLQYMILIDLNIYHMFN